MTEPNTGSTMLLNDWLVQAINALNERVLLLENDIRELQEALARSQTQS